MHQCQHNASVRLQKARMSVAHITTLNQARQGLLQLDPGAIQPGTGSGFLWDTSGHIVTNFHVVQNASRVKVTLSDQRTHDAALVGVDPNNDVAVLKLPSDAAATGGGNEPISVGTSHDLMVGQKVFAIGNPFGLDQTLTGAHPPPPTHTKSCMLQVSHRCLSAGQSRNGPPPGRPRHRQPQRLLPLPPVLYHPCDVASVAVSRTPLVCPVKPLQSHLRICACLLEASRKNGHNPSPPPPPTQPPLFFSLVDLSVAKHERASRSLNMHRPPTMLHLNRHVRSARPPPVGAPACRRGAHTAAPGATTHPAGVIACASHM